MGGRTLCLVVCSGRWEKCFFRVEFLLENEKKERKEIKKNIKDNGISAA